MITTIVAAHKPYEMPKDSMYLPLHVGAYGKDSIGYKRDDDGENISKKNPYYSELTGLYWAWKNLDSEYIGLSHYRRHFKSSRAKSPLTGEEAKKLLSNGGIIVPKKRKYYIESLYSHYSHTLDRSHLDIAKDIIESDCPEYLAATVTVYSRTWGYMWNMAIMPKEDLNRYCCWLFPILEKMEAKIDTSEMDAFDARLFGRVSEILFNVWLDKENKKLIEVSVFSVEPVPWGKKIISFLAAKFIGKKYKKSF